MNVFSLFGTIGLKDDGFSKGIKEAEDKTKGFGAKLSSVMADVKKAAVDGLDAVAGAFASVGTQSVKAYADYEQLTGGVETLFKDSAGIVNGYAQEAYKTAGLSANEYMKTVTGFSASLLQGLGGDTQRAAEIGNMAVIDMSDTANKMGALMQGSGLSIEQSMDLSTQAMQRAADVASIMGVDTSAAMEAFAAFNITQSVIAQAGVIAAGIGSLCVYMLAEGMTGKARASGGETEIQHE